MRTKIEALKDLGEKITGKTIDVKDGESMLYGEDIVEIIDAITENYEGGSGGGGDTPTPTGEAVLKITTSGWQTDGDIEFVSFMYKAIGTPVIPPDPEEGDPGDSGVRSLQIYPTGAKYLETVDDPNGSGDKVTLEIGQPLSAYFDKMEYGWTDSDNWEYHKIADIDLTQVINAPIYNINLPYTPES